MSGFRGFLFSGFPLFLAFLCPVSFLLLAQAGPLILYFRSSFRSSWARGRSGFMDFWNSGFLFSWVSGFRGVWVPGFLVFGVSVVLSFPLSCFLFAFSAGGASDFIF